MELEVGKMYRTRGGALAYVYAKYEHDTDHPFVVAQINPERSLGVIPLSTMSYNEAGLPFIGNHGEAIKEEVDAHFPENKYDSPEVRALKIISNMHMANNNTLACMVVPLVHGVLQNKPNLKEKAAYHIRWIRGYGIGAVLGLSIVISNWLVFG